MSRRPYYPSASEFVLAVIGIVGGSAAILFVIFTLVTGVHP